MDISFQEDILPMHRKLIDALMKKNAETFRLQEFSIPFTSHRIIENEKTYITHNFDKFAIIRNCQHGLS